MTDRLRLKHELKDNFSNQMLQKCLTTTIMAVYYEQNVTSEKFEDFDGERWIIPDD